MSFETHIKALSRCRLFAAVASRHLEELATTAREVALGAGELLFSAGDPSKGLFLVLEGRTRAVRHGTDGREQIIHEDPPYSTFPEVAVFDDGPYPSTVVAVEDSTLLFIPKQKLREFCVRHPEAALAALEILASRLRKATGMVEDLALRDVSQRLAEYLLRQSEQRGGVRSFQLIHSNQEIADLIGSVREVVSRSFARLQRAGWISKRGRQVEIRDREGLRDHIEREYLD